MTISTNTICSLKQLSKDLKAGKQLRIQSNGELQFTGKGPNLIDRILNRHNNNLSKLPDAFCKRYLDPLESTAILFDPKNALPGVSLAEKDIKAKQLQNDYFAAVLEAKEAIDNAISKANIKNKKAALLPLSARMISMQYRFEKENGGLNPLPKDDVRMDVDLWNMAKKWKASQANYPKSDRGLTVRDDLHLIEISRYPHFLDLLKRYESLRNTYFKWAIRDHGQEKAFIQYLKHWELLDNSYLAPRIAYYGSELLAVTKKNSKKFSGRKKVLTLPIEVMTSANQLEVKPKNILDHNKEVTLNKGWKLSIKRIIEIFANKNLDFGDLEFFGKGGIKNWSSQKLARFNPATNSYDSIDFNAPNWWEQLPNIESVNPITVQELQRLYNNLEGLKPNEWVVIVRGTRTAPTLDINKSHGFIEVAIPQGDGTFKLYPFGKLAAVFPNGALQLLAFLANTVESRIYYPDENIYYNYRQHAAWVRRMADKVECHKLMDLIKEFLMLAKSGNLVFQFGWENCAFLPQKIVESLFGRGNVPDFFRTNVIELQAPFPLNVFFGFVRWFPSFMQSCMIKGIEFIFGGFRGMHVVENGKKVFKSVWRSPLSTEKSNYLPAKLAHFILNKKIPGTVWHGVK